MQTRVAAGARADAGLTAKEIHLIRSTYKVLGAKGMDRLALQDVADEAGVSKGTVLYYFESKHNLVMQTMRWAIDRVARRARRALMTAATAEGQLAAVIDAIAIGAEANRRFYLTFFDLLVYEAREDRAKTDDLSAIFYHACDELFAEIIAQGLEEGAFHVADVAEAAATVRALMDGLFVQWVAGEGWQRRHGAYVARCKRAALAYLRAGG